MNIVIIDDEKIIAEKMASEIQKEIPDSMVAIFDTYESGFNHVLVGQMMPDIVYFILDGDLVDKDKTGIDILKAMTLEQREHTIFASFNPVLTKRALEEFGVTVWTKTDIAKGLIGKVIAMEPRPEENEGFTLRDITKMKICNCCSGQLGCWKADPKNGDAICGRILDLELFIKKWAKEKVLKFLGEYKSELFISYHTQDELKREIEKEFESV